VAADYLQQLEDEGTWTPHKEGMLAEVLAVMYAGGYIIPSGFLFSR
jgi:hypothetical protein